VLTEFVGICWGAGILAVTECSDILANSFRDRQYSAATELSLHRGFKKGKVYPKTDHEDPEVD
jgi:hypothetical protein